MTKRILSLAPFAAGVTGALAVGSSPQSLVDHWREQQPAGAVAAALVGRAGPEFFFAGPQSQDDTNPPTADTFFEIGSITKGFTGLLLADRVLAGRVRLADTLAQRLTDWSGRTNSPAAGVTLLQLATHRSGLPRLPANMDAAWLARYGSDPYARYDVARLYHWLDDAKPEVDPDGHAAFLYSNVGFAILGHALAVAADEPYETLLRQRVLRPLGLTNTIFRLSRPQRARLATGHHNVNAVPNWAFQVFASAGGLRSTPRDMARFVATMAGLGENPLRQASALATSAQAPETGKATIGFGWLRTPRRSGLLIWHNGGTGGYRSFAGWYPEHHIGVVVLASIDESVDKLGTDLLDTLLPAKSDQ